MGEHDFKPFTTTSRGAAGPGSTVRCIDSAKISYWSLKSVEAFFQPLISRHWKAKGREVEEPSKRRRIEDTQEDVSVLGCAGTGSKLSAASKPHGDEVALGLTEEDYVIAVEFRGKGFLRHMVRRLVSALLLVAKQKHGIHYIREVLQ